MISGLHRRLVSGNEPPEGGPANETRTPRRHAPPGPSRRTAAPGAPLPPRSALPAAPLQVSAYEQWQARAQAHTVRPGTYSYSRAGKEMALALGSGAQAAVGALAATGATMLLASAVNRDDDDTRSGNMDLTQIMALTAGPMLAGAATGLVSGLIGAVRKGRLSTAQAQIATHEKFQRDTAGELQRYPADVRDAVRRTDLVLEQLFKPVEWGDPVDAARVERLLRLRQVNLMALPSRPKVVTEWTTRAGRAVLDARIHEAVRTFPEEVRENLANVLQRIAANSVADDDTGKRRLQFRLKGPGGTGKDTFIRLIKEILNLPVVELVVPPERDGGIEGLLGKEWEAIEQNYPTSDEEMFGKLGIALLKSGFSNTVVFLNEIKLDEPGVNNGLKRLLDPARKSIELKSLSAQIDWSHQTVFVASNDDINPDHALESRWETIELPRATPETKEMVARDIHNRESKNYRKPLADGHPVLDAAQQDELDRIFDAVLPLFIGEHGKKFPGARMEFARSVTTFIAQELRGQNESVEEKTRAFITGHFRTIQSAAPPDAHPPAGDDSQPTGD